MSNSFIGEIDLFGFNYAPQDWAFADGSTVNVQQYAALFALIGATYGGNGQTTLMLPNLSQRIGCGQGAGPGLTPRSIGAVFGAPEETVSVNEMPNHGHGWNVENGADLRTANPSAGSFLAATRPQASIYLAGQQPNTSFSPKTISPTGGSQPHDNRQPYLAINYCICLFGDFPSFD